MARFVSSDYGQIEEKALNVGNSGRSAKIFFKFVRNTLDNLGNTFDGLASQAYDGDSVIHSPLCACRERTLAPEIFNGGW